MKNEIRRDETRQQVGVIKKSESDLVQLILADHKPLKELIQIMTSESAEFEAVKGAFMEFATELTLHAKPEEMTMYREMKNTPKLRKEGLEGDVEHSMADQLCEELKRTTDKDVFIAKVKVLGELVGHHIEEEESEMLKDFAKKFDVKKRIELGEAYIHLQEDLMSQGATDSPSEADLH